MREGKTSLIFFIIPLDKCGPMWYNRGVDKRAANAQAARISDLLPHMENFLGQKWTSYAPIFFPKLYGGRDNANVITIQ